MFHDIRLGFFHAKRERGKHVCTEVNGKDLFDSECQRHERQAGRDYEGH